MILKCGITLITLKYYTFIDPEKGKSVNNFITRLSGEATDESIFQPCYSCLFHIQIHT